VRYRPRGPSGLRGLLLQKKISRRFAARRKTHSVRVKPRLDLEHFTRSTRSELQVFAKGQRRAPRLKRVAPRCARLIDKTQRWSVAPAGLRSSFVVASAPKVKVKSVGGALRAPKDPGPRCAREPKTARISLRSISLHPARAGRSLTLAARAGSGALRATPRTRRSALARVSPARNPTAGR
jgi:hypothetical protein